MAISMSSGPEPAVEDRVLLAVMMARGAGTGAADALGPSDPLDTAVACSPDKAGETGLKAAVAAKSNSKSGMALVV